MLGRIKMQKASPLSGGQRGSFIRPAGTISSFPPISSKSACGAENAPRKASWERPIAPPQAHRDGPEERQGLALYCGMTSTNQSTKQGAQPAPGAAGATFEGVTAALAQSMRSARLVDLSLTLSEDLPCAWPGAMPYRHVVDNWFETTAGGASGPGSGPAPASLTTLVF